MRILLKVVATLIAQQKVATAKRNRLALEQENAVIKLLEDTGWKRLPSKLVDTRAAVPAKHFMHKTRFATKSRPQEVDVACGLKDTYVLAMECKVTNDETNSVKRINDVLKKATAWHDHWGSFVYAAVRWSRFPGQFGGLAKIDSGFDYAASFSSFACIA